eukprot:TRINITY_DN14469_c0_g1_i1.p1 TRINITY_DN14469_c0_g1~~TRINITY_DN14469_c0_g1_i1.p1  ORF type:complete len:537 (-),score=41.54 TRINITY_DN14469_c0_g1_i1:174-1703(-)
MLVGVTIVAAFFVSQGLAVMLSLPGSTSSLVRHAGRHAEKKPNAYGEIRQRMTNYFDTQYTSIIRVGGQSVKAIVDTGSFELLVFGANCSNCGSSPHLYNESLSKTFRNFSFDKVHTYGSGETTSTEVSDVLQVGPMISKNQTFWEVHDAKMPILREDSFASIFGVGPPTSVGKFADADAEQAHQDVQNLESGSSEITDDMKDTVAEYDVARKRAWSSKSVVERLNVRSVSFCMGRTSGSDGYVVWNDTAPKRFPSKFMTIENAGNSYWSANMTNVVLSSPLNIVANTSSKSKGETLGCETQCSAVIDTGTSLIAAPSSVVTKLNGIIQAWTAKGGTCDDLSGLPNLEFNLNGHRLTLPPESYVGRASGAFGARSQLLRRAMPHLTLDKNNQTSSCTSLLMSMDADAPEGPMWILGMPFFREYYTTFMFRIGKKHFRHQPYAMAFSRSNDACYPSEAPRHRAAGSEMTLIDESSGVRASQLNVDVSKILMPWASKGGKSISRRFLFEYA